MCEICPTGTCCCASEIKIQTPSFWVQVKKSYPSAVGIIVLCILSSQVGQSISFVLFGYHNLFGIVMSYALGYGLASLTTFGTIIGRYTSRQGLGACCSAIEQGSSISFISNLKNTFRYCGIGMKKIPHLHKLPDVKHVIKTSLYILVTAESACILTAETVNLAFFRQAMWLSMPLGLFAAAFVVTIIESYKMTRTNK
ncbi:hypothetical protein DYY67_2039 [Candidatus Nitrosotalea sp. TS]|uniref:hypothetical protein n=1 Tax=Candidatus Nitrosotalea sp. TS TaxID=2341020 RepID=UPI00140DD3E7|nr:hypothetical protein [Candidatus Nitrosotalea sp. TS]NHI02357.1 hypothetical protein [Candidatus Nitrosotalea sp. TS]